MLFHSKMELQSLRDFREQNFISCSWYMYFMGQERNTINCSSSETTISKLFLSVPEGRKKRTLQSLTLAIKFSGLEVTNPTASCNSLARNSPLGLSTKEESDAQSYQLLGKEQGWSYVENSTHDVIPRYSSL